MPKKTRKIILAYSGGLDTSVILVWLKEHYGCEVCTFTADLGQGEEIGPAREKAEKLGAESTYIEDLRAEFVQDFIFPMLRSNAVYEAEYLLGTSIARPLIAKRLTEIAQQQEAFAIAHGATGKGNDQIRFELGIHALDPTLKIIAPWREWDMNSRTALLKYARDHGIETGQGKPPYSIDANLLHVSYEGNELEDPWQSPDDEMWQRTASLESAPQDPQIVTVSFEKGDPVGLDGQKLPAVELLEKLNAIAARHGIGRTDIVENRYIGMKSRGCYETPGGEVILKTRRALESLVLDRELQHLKDDLMSRYARLIYNGYWWSDERIALQKIMDADREYVRGEVRIKLYKGNIVIMGRKSSDSLLDEKISTFDDDAGVYDQKDAGGFIRLNALRLELVAKRRQKHATD